MVLAVEGLTKSFGAVAALRDGRLRLTPGRVTALIGENGAGKSTLVKILTGIYQPDAGSLRLDGAERHFASPQESQAAGIAAIHQETVMFDDLTVAENICAGHWPCHARGWRKGMIDWKALLTQAQAVLDRLGADLPLQARCGDLSIAQKHLVEMARALCHDSRVLIMDEPTAALSHREIDDLYRLVRTLKAGGVAILFISHKFDELFAIADDYVVMRDGAFVAEGAMSETNVDALVALMVGRSMGAVFPKRSVPIGAPVLDVRDLCHPTEFSEVSFTVHAGEILGFYGLVGAGRSEVMQALFGLTPVSGGTISLGGENLRLTGPKDAIAAGIAYVPEDRQSQGAILPMSIRDNITLPLLERITGGWLLSSRKEDALAETFARRLAVKAPDWNTRVDALSGGNQQKVVIGKWLATAPKVIILDEPTKGIDVGSKAKVHDFMSDLVAEGLAVILVSSELPEVMGMADRIIVMQAGRPCGSFKRADFATDPAQGAARLARAATGG